MVKTRELASKRTVRLTTRGRKTGRPRTVTIWFVVAGPGSIFVQHATRAAAHWYRNLLAEPACSVDFGSGPIPARASPIHDVARIHDVLWLVRRKYWLAWVFQLLGRNHEAVAAEIALTDG